MLHCFVHIIAPARESQRTCTIISTSLTTPRGVLAYGTEDVILYCICMVDDVAVGPTRWFFNETQVTATQANGNNPYYRDNVPSPLIIPLFATGYDGTYRCESDSGILTPDDSITLTLSGTYLYNYFSKLRINFVLALIMVCMFMSATMAYHLIKYYKPYFH